MRVPYMGRRRAKELLHPGVRISRDQSCGANLERQWDLICVSLGRLLLEPVEDRMCQRADRAFAHGFVAHRETKSGKRWRFANGGRDKIASR